VYDEDARKYDWWRGVVVLTSIREFLTGFRKRKQERRRVANDALAEKERIARRNAKKERKLELMRAYGVEVQEHMEEAPAGTTANAGIL
jgi:hypothetical protein